MSSPSRPLLIAIEGGIGAGKSTVLARLKALFKDKIGIAFVDEPAEEWTEHGFLQGMYDGTINRAAFQHMVLMSLAGDLLKTLATDRPVVVISERSPWGNYNVFGKANLTDKELAMYHFTWERVLGGMPSSLNVKYVYMKAPVSCLQDRTDHRARDGEGKIPCEYMQLLDKLHDEWLDTIPSGTGKAVIDATKTEEEIFKDVCSAIGGWMEEAARGHVRGRKTPDQQERDRMMLGSADLESLNALCSDALSAANGESAAKRQRKDKEK